MAGFAQIYPIFAVSKFEDVRLEFGAFTAFYSCLRVGAADDVASREEWSGRRCLYSEREGEACVGQCARWRTGNEKHVLRNFTGQNSANDNLQNSINFATDNPGGVGRVRSLDAKF